MRRVSLEALVVLYKDASVVAQLDLFTQRFRPRIVNMCEDIAPTVVETALDAVTQLHAAGELEPEQAARLADLVYADVRAVARAAGRLAHQAFIKPILAAPMEESTTSSPAAVRALKAIARLGVRTGRMMLDSKAAYLADALWPCCPELQVRRATTMPTGAGAGVRSHERQSRMLRWD